MENENKTSIAERIYELRKNSGKSQGELADMLNVSRQSVSKWENGTSNPEIENLVELSKIFDVSVDDIINYDKTKTIKQPQTYQTEAISKLQTKNNGGLVLLCGLIIALVGLFINFVLAGIGAFVAIVGICMLTFKKDDYIHNAWVLFGIFYVSTLGLCGTLFSCISLLMTIGISQAFSTMPGQMLFQVTSSLIFALLTIITIAKSQGTKSLINRAIFIFFFYAFGVMFSSLTSAWFGMYPFLLPNIAVYGAFVIAYIICAKKKILNEKTNMILILSIIAMHVYNIGMKIYQIISINGAQSFANPIVIFNFAVNIIFIAIFAILAKKQKSLRN